MFQHLIFSNLGLFETFLTKFFTVMDKLLNSSFITNTLYEQLLIFTTDKCNVLDDSLTFKY